MSAYKRKKIGEILIDRGDLSPSDLSFVLAILKTTGDRFGKVCLINSLVSEEALAKALAEQFGMEYVELEGFKIDENILDIFPKVLPADAIYRYHFVPLEVSGDALVVAVDDPTDVIRLDELEFFLARPLICKVATGSAIESVLRKDEGITWEPPEVLEVPSNGCSCGVKIPVNSIEKSVSFYRDILGLGIRKQSQEMVVFDPGLVLVPLKYAGNLPAGLHLRSLVYVQAADIEERFTQAVKRNVRIVSQLAKWDQSGKLFFRCLDPDGNVVEVIPYDGL